MSVEAEEVDRRRMASPIEQTFEVLEGAAILKQTESWYLAKLRSGELPGHKAGRRWYLTQSDITKAQELTARRGYAVTPNAAGFAPRRRRRSSNRARG
ncbi:DNA-binding protein [Nocardia altamirensis]|uniref:DNA-binding protein n=1 Tax=Nocardia altamirensis TaxID=472158 RepID=UPI00083FE64E|nr:DNA-binding protein [Nocardia altamirensis]